MVIKLGATTEIWEFQYVSICHRSCRISFQGHPRSKVKGRVELAGGGFLLVPHSNFVSICHRWRDIALQTR